MKADAEKTQELKERREILADALNTLKDERFRKSQGDALTILKPTVDALAVAAAAQVLKNGSSSLLLSLKVALQNIEMEESQAGVLGKVLSTSTKGVSDLIVKAYLAKEDAGSKEFFLLLIQALVITAISISWKLAQFNLGYGSEKEEDLRTQTFGFELILLLILRTGIIQVIVKTVAEACGAEQRQQESIAGLLKALILILSLLTASKGSEATLKMLVLDLKEDLIAGLMDLQEFINKIGEAEQTSELAATLSIYIQQALASLQEEDFETLYNAYSEALAEIQANPQLMENDIEKVIQFAELITTAFTQGSADLRRNTAAIMI